MSSEARRHDVVALAQELFTRRCSGEFSPYWLETTSTDPAAWKQVAQVALVAAEAFISESRDVYLKHNQP